jgi:hypothetical protein
MKRFINNILKPIVIFSVYLTLIVWTSQIISLWCNVDIMLSSLVMLMILYPIYLYFINL